MVAKQVGVALLMKQEQVGSSDWLGGLLISELRTGPEVLSSAFLP